MMDKIDVNGNSRIDYEEFLAATMHLSKLNREENMMDAFKHFDKDNSGFITKDEILVSHARPHAGAARFTSQPRPRLGGPSHVRAAKRRRAEHRAAGVGLP